MCRLYGFRANEPTKVECTLVHAQNALLIQSQADLRGVSHADGWGIGFYAGPFPTLVKRGSPAYEDMHFSVTAERVYTETVIAHIRRATVGETSPANAHPFSCGNWVFAHNGTVTGFSQLEDRLAGETEPALRNERKGSTDSEAAFLWLMSRLRAAGLARGSPDESDEDIYRVFADSVATLKAWCAEAAPDEQARLNFLLTDGVRLFGSRYWNSLYVLKRDGVHDCEICGIPHIRHDPTTPYHAVVLASEPITHEYWREVPDDSALMITRGFDVSIRPLPEHKLQPVG